MKTFTNMMQKMGDQITKTIDCQMTYMMEKFRHTSSLKSSAQKKPMQFPINKAP